jgi:formylglycine-generating enzyme
LYSGKVFIFGNRRKKMKRAVRKTESEKRDRVLTCIIPIISVVITGTFLIINTYVKYNLDKASQPKSNDIQVENSERKEITENSQNAINNKEDSNTTQNTAKPTIGAKRENTNYTSKRIVMVKVPRGIFKLGSIKNNYFDAQPIHQVTINSDIYVSRNEITFNQYSIFCLAKKIKVPDDNGWGKGERPIINVSWYDAIEFCNWLSSTENRGSSYKVNGKMVICDFDSDGYRLPTEAEWEYIASRNDDRSNKMYFDVETGWLKNNSDGMSHEVGVIMSSKNPINDLCGNVKEWCWDWYGPRYTTIQEIDPCGPDSGEFKCIRGGSWNDEIEFVSISKREKQKPEEMSIYSGFRVVYTERKK